MRKPIRKSRLGTNILLIIAPVCILLGIFFIRTTPGQAEAIPIKYNSPTTSRTELDFNSGWKFQQGNILNAEQPNFDDSAWTSLSLPHTWNNLDGQDGNSDYLRGFGWYRKNFSVDSAYATKQIYIQFNAVNQVAEVYLNGKLLYTHFGGYAAFRVNLTQDINLGGANLLAVRVNNSPNNTDIIPLSADFTFFGGIYRDVKLLVTDKLQVNAMFGGTSGIFLRASNVSASSADLRVVVKLANAYPTPKTLTVRTSVVDAEQNIVQTINTDYQLGANTTDSITQTTIINNPHLWNGRLDPYLYQTFVEVVDTTDGANSVTDVVSQPLGFRFFSINPNTGFFLNGQPYDLHGVNRHQDRLNKGWAIGRSEQDEDMALIKEIGATVVRLAHYQHDDYFYGLADKEGLVIWSEIPYVRLTTDSANFNNITGQMLAELIYQNYNHPSIMFWSTSNEVGDSAAFRALAPQLNNIVKQLDDTRLSTADCYVLSSACTFFYESNFPDVMATNFYYGWYIGTVSDFPVKLDELHTQYPNLKLAVGEYGAGASLYQHTASSQAPAQGGTFHQEEYQNFFHESYWASLKTRPFIWGKFIWNMFDFAIDSRNEGDSPGRNDKGLVSYDRKTKKDAFYWYKANWSNEPVVYITSRRWDYRTTATTDIKIYSNFDTVELRVNGVSMGNLTAPSHIFKWANVTLPQGRVQIEAIATRNGQIYTDTVQWTINSAGLVKQQLTSGTSLNLSAISCPTVAVCYAAGNNALILNTQDAGAHWAAQTNPGATNIETINCPTTTICYAGGANGLFLTTTDGQTWAAGSIPTTATITSLSCPSGTTCYAVADKQVFKTVNSGQSWVSQTLAVSLNSISCPTEQNCVIAGNTKHYYTFDGATNWFATANLTVNAIALDCFDYLKCYSSSTSSLGGSYNGGVSWRTVSFAGVKQNIRAVNCPGLMVCYATGDLGNYYYNFDNSYTWQVANTGTTFNFKALDCPDQLVCYLVGDNGRIFRLAANSTNLPTARITAVSGNNQTLTVGQNLENPLGILLTNLSGAPLANTTISFTAPLSGASGLFEGNTTTYTATTNASGLATVDIFTANLITGAYNLQALPLGVGPVAPVLFTLTNISPPPPVCNVFVVSKNSDDSSCGTLSAAISAANTYTEPVTIIITPGMNLISIATELPVINNINGLPVSLKGNCQIVDGIAQPGTQLIAGGVISNGLQLGHNVSVEGFSLGGFSEFGLNILGDNNSVSCTWLGTNDGFSAAANGVGLRLVGSNNNLGVPEVITSGNLISGNSKGGIITESSARNNKIYFTGVGYAKDRLSLLANNGYSIRVAPGSQLLFYAGNKIRQ